MGFFRQEYWSGLPCPPPWDLPNPGIETASPVAPALARGFFTTRATWEVHSYSYFTQNSISKMQFGTNVQWLNFGYTSSPPTYQKEVKHPEAFISNLAHKNFSGFAGGLVVKNPPASEGTWIWPQVWEATCHGATKPVLQLLRQSSRALKPQLLSPHTRATKAHTTRACAPQREATTIRSPHNTTQRRVATAHHN